MDSIINNTGFDIYGCNTGFNLFQMVLLEKTIIVLLLLIAMLGIICLGKWFYDKLNKW
ncbi:hypothetical protein [Flavobacterium sp. GT3P67]|uniref:hypothetical protein n=1 Tax=Flavobacterium sp. GT3P67 TaxID=2541722 RepID=UPI0014049FE9|nr:hypothetical protein [Flavobacterium sp. GT3P67]